MLFYTRSQTGNARHGGKKKKERKEENGIFKHSSNKQNACSYWSQNYLDCVGQWKASFGRQIQTSEM